MPAQLLPKVTAESIPPDSPTGLCHNHFLAHNLSSQNKRIKNLFCAVSFFGKELFF